MATGRDWVEGYLAPARSDLAAAVLVGTAEPSVFAMLMQMVFEKFAKAALLRSGSTLRRDVPMAPVRITRGGARQALAWWLQVALTVRLSLPWPVLLRLGGAFIAAVLSRFLRLGWAAARGLPDLLVLPGPGSRLSYALPSGLPESAFLAEIKGPTDTVRDSQRLWHEHLMNQHIYV